MNADRWRGLRLRTRFDWGVGRSVICGVGVAVKSDYSSALQTLLTFPSRTHFASRTALR